MIDVATFRRMAHEAVEVAADHLARTLSGDDPVFKPMTAQERSRLAGMPLPGEGAEPEAILQVVRDQIFPHAMGNGHPRFFGWVNSPPSPIGVLGDMLAATLNPSCAGGDHAAIYVERCAIRWLRELIGYTGGSSAGLLVSGGSTATLTALAAARHRALAAAGGDARREGLQGSRSRLAVYASEEAHSCIRKAVELLGLGSDCLRRVPVDRDRRLRPSALRSAITEDRRAGAIPCCVVASAGTVATGAIDPLADLADICAEEQTWLHVDGAYGALGVLDPAIAPAYRGMERAESVALDPHKWLSVPVECGAVLVRDADALRSTFSLVPAYLATEEGKGFGGTPWYSEYGFQQTRGFRALKLWMVLAQLGRNGAVEHVVRHNALASRLAELVRSAPDLDLAAEPVLSIVCFRYRPEGWSDDDHRLNQLNRDIMHALQAEGEVFLTNATLDDRFVLRACILHYGTTERDLLALVEAVRRRGAAETG